MIRADLGVVNGMAQLVNRRKMIMRVEVLMGKIMHVCLDKAQEDSS